MNLTPDAIIMNKVVDVISSDSNSGIRDFVSFIIPKLPAIALMVALKKCMESSGEIFWGIVTCVSTVLRKMLYTDLVIEHVNHAENTDYYRKKVYEKKKSLLGMRSFFPMYWVSEENQPSVLSYLKWLPSHSDVVSECEEDAQVDQHIYDHAKSLKKTIYKKLTTEKGSLTYVNSKASKLFPSKNYTELVKIIKSHLSVAKIVKSYTVLGVLIDGQPGLGKTKFADFAVEQKLAGSVYKVDMTTMLKYPFSEALDRMYHSVEIVTDAIFMIDEIDKYVDFRLDLEYDQEVKASQKHVKDEAVVLPNAEYFKQQQKVAFLYDMLSILERDGLDQSVVVIFCSNNFHSIFDGVDLTHHKSLYDRFMKVNFKECDHEEIINYLIHYNEMFKTSEFERDLNVEVLQNSLRKDINVTHRTLHHISIKSRYDAFQMIELLNNHVSEDDSGESLDSKIKNKKEVTKYDVLPSKKAPLEEKDTVSTTSEEDSSSEEPCTLDSDEHIVFEAEAYECSKKNYENLKEHEKLWVDKYSISPPNFDKNTCVNKIKTYLNEDPDQQLKPLKAIELFDYIATDGYYLLHTHEKFKDVVRFKMDQFYHTHPELFILLKPETKMFAYALTGLQ